jgi:hypothetical protein
MKSVAGWITTGKNEWLRALTVWKLTHRIEGLVENSRQTHWMSRRTIATVVIGRVRHVAAMIWRIQRFVVPAHEKEHLHAKAILTEVFIGFEIHLFGARKAFRNLSNFETRLSGSPNKRNGLFSD